MTEQAVTEFLVESRESLSAIENDLIAMESGPLPPEKVAGIFRAIHTIKGTSGFLGLPRLEALVHHGEGVLSALREARIASSAELAATLIAMVDVVRRFLSEIEASGREGATDPAPVIEKLRRLLDASPGTAAPLAGGAAEPLADGSLHETEGSVRVDVRLLDKLMDLVGELVLVRNQALQLANRGRETEFLAPVQRLNLVATELQQSVMKTRMQPIGNLWSKLPRVVRDLALACGKRVRLDMEGTGTELDRTIIEAVKAPLTHLVRNAVDHGVEAPEVRAAAGKSPEGRILLRAYHEGGNVNLEISDDGGGVDWHRVGEKAVQLGLATPEAVARADERELSELLFRPGFSTAERLTTVSGRGVGLDVVKTNVEKIGGAVDVQSRPGAGTTIRVKIPLTLAIIPALIVTSGGQRYAIPQVNVLEIVRVEDRRALEAVLGAPLYRLRGKLLTLLDLDRELSGQPSESAGSGHVVVVRAEERTFGLLVESVNDTEEIVVKPLPKQAKDVSAFAGATIMGNGRVALILDAVGLAQRASLLAEARSAPRAVEERARAERTESLLVVEVCGGESAAIPLGAVARIEELHPSRIERSGGREVVQYRGEIMPLVRVSTAFGRAPATREDATVPVVVHAGPDGSVGLAVDRIVDVVEEVLATRRKSPRPGVLFSSVVQQRVTEVLDVAALVAGARDAGESAS